MGSISENQQPLGFLWLGGHPAIDFANTHLPPPGPDIEFLQSWGAVVDWLVEMKFSDKKSLHVSDTAKALERVKDLRSTWKMELTGIIAGRAVHTTFIERLNEILERESFTEILRCEEGQNLHLHRSSSLLKGEALALAIFARQIAEFLVIAEFKSLRHCANKDSCSVIFYDTTKNHRRQWCSNSMCGNRHKVAEFRRRLKEEAAQVG